MKAVIATFAAALALAAPAAAQTYPVRPVTMVVPFAAGGTTDIIARLMADEMTNALGQPIIVENTVGAGGTVGVTRVKGAPADGYTLLMGNMGTQAASVGLYPKLAYDPRTDFEPIINSGGTPMLIVARNDLPVKDLREFVAYVRQNAAKVNYGTGGVGATSHLTCLYFDALIDAKPQHVPFRGSGPALNALLAGQIDYVCDQTVTVVPQIQARTVKGLVVAVEKRLAVVPDVPTSAEGGLPQFQAMGWNAMFAPKGTPKAVLDRLNAAGRSALASANLKKRLDELGVEVPRPDGQTREALAELVRTEIDKWVPIIKKAGVAGQ